MRLEHNAETHQVVLWTMGPAHVEEILGRLRDRYGVEVEAEPVRTSLRETFVRRCTVQGRHVKQSRRARPVRGVPDRDRAAGARRPASSSSTRSSAGRCRASSSPRSRRARGRSWRRACCAGYPVVDVRITLVRRQGALGRLVRHGVPDGGGDRAAGGGQRGDRVAARADRQGRHHGRRRLRRLGAGRPARRGGARCTGPSRPRWRAGPWSTPRCPQVELSRYPIDLRSVSHGTGLVHPVAAPLRLHARRAGQAAAVNA